MENLLGDGRRLKDGSFGITVVVRIQSGCRERRVRITSKGQVTIPQKIRDQAGLQPGMEVDFQLDEDGVVRLVRPERQPANPVLVRAIDRLRGKADTSMSTEEIMALTRG